ALARPLPAGSKTEVGDAPTVGGAADFRILSQVADQDDLVEAATHGGPPLQGYRNEHGGALPPDSTNARAGDPTRIALKMTKSTLRHGRRQCLPQDQGVFDRPAIVPGPFSGDLESATTVQRLRGGIALPDFQPDLAGPHARERFESL